MGDLLYTLHVTSTQIHQVKCCISITGDPECTKWEGRRVVYVLRKLLWLQAMLDSDFRKRPTAEAVLNHRFWSGALLWVNPVEIWNRQTTLGAVHQGYLSCPHIFPFQKLREKGGRTCRRRFPTLPFLGNPFVVSLL